MKLPAVVNNSMCEVVIAMEDDDERLETYAALYF